MKKLKADIETYFNAQNKEAREILCRLREIFVGKAPEATEKISYGIPSFHNNGVIIYYAAFKKHFSIFPPIKGDEALLRETKQYANDKGNLLFKYKDPIPWNLIEKVMDRLILENSMRKGEKA